MASVYYFYDEVQERGIDPPPFLERIWKKLLRAGRADPARAPPLSHARIPLHALHPGEAELIDAQLIRDTCLVGTADELIERIRALANDGLDELIFAVGTKRNGTWRRNSRDR